MNLPTAAEIDDHAASYKGWLNLAAQHAPSAMDKKLLSTIETRARKLIEAIEGIDGRARDVLAMNIGEAIDTDGLMYLQSMEYSAPLGRSMLNDILRLANIVSVAARKAHDKIPKGGRYSAQRFAADNLRELFAKHGLKFTATADEYGNTSHAVATLLVIAHKAGDVEMTIDAARKWIEKAIREKVPQKIDDGFPIP